MNDRTCVIVNPESGRGRGAKMIPSLAAAFAEVGSPEIRTTAHGGDETRAATEAISAGYTTLVVVGGDGTMSNVANAILQSGEDVRLAVMPAGTGNDFAKLLGTVSADARTVARLCATAPDQRVDAGKIEDRYFVNCCGFGFDVAVLQGIRKHKRLRGNAVYVYTAIAELFGYRGSKIGVKSVASTRPPEKHMMLVLANASYFGGTFEIAPGAVATDGKLDAISILDVPAWKRAAVLGAALLGRHEFFRECVRERSGEFELSFEEPPTYDADGELHRAGSADLRVSSCPRALRVVANRNLGPDIDS
ncbi:MAG: diacylglycerol/lipid kinase family protein [Gemmatimonadaceae bacterium]